MLPSGNPCTVHTAHRQAAPARAVFLILAPALGTSFQFQ